MEVDGLRGVVSGGLDRDDISGGAGLESVVSLECEVCLEYDVLVGRLLSPLCIIFSFHCWDFCNTVSSLSSTLSESSVFF